MESNRAGPSKVRARGAPRIKFQNRRYAHSRPRVVSAYSICICPVRGCGRGVGHATERVRQRREERMDKLLARGRDRTCGF